MAIRFEQLHSKQGVLMRAFFVYNRRGKVLALGAVRHGDSLGYCLMHAKRLENDLPLVQAVERLTAPVTGVTVRRHEWEKGRKGCQRIVRPADRGGTIRPGRQVYA